MAYTHATHTHGTHTVHTHSRCRHELARTAKTLLSVVCVAPISFCASVCVCVNVRVYVCVLGNGCPAHMQFIFLLPRLLYRSPDVASTKPSSGFGLQLVLLVAVDLLLLLVPAPAFVLCSATLQLSSSAKQKACCLISARVAKLPSSALPCLALPYFADSVVVLCATFLQHYGDNNNDKYKTS